MLQQWLCSQSRNNDRILCWIGLQVEVVTQTIGGFIDASLKILHNTVQSPPPVPPAPNRCRLHARLICSTTFLERTDEKVDFVLQYFKINFYTVLGFWIEYLILCVAITSAPDRNNNFLSGSGVMQDLHYIKTKRGEKKLQSHSCCSPQTVKTLWNRDDKTVIRVWTGNKIKERFYKNKYFYVVFLKCFTLSVATKASSLKQVLQRLNRIRQTDEKRLKANLFTGAVKSKLKPIRRVDLSTSGECWQDISNMPA